MTGMQQTLKQVHPLRLLERAGMGRGDGEGGGVGASHLRSMSVTQGRLHTAVENTCVCHA